MTSSESALSDLAARLAGSDASLSTSLRDILTAALQELIEAELTAMIGAAPGERTPERTAQRNGHRSKLLSTPGGDVEVGIPKLRQGSFFPELLEPRRRVDRALWAVIMTAYITGTSTRKVDDLVKALGCDSGISKSTVSRICTQIDADVAVLRTRRLDHQPFVYVWLDATYVHVREHRHVVSKAVVIATGLRGWRSGCAGSGTTGSVRCSTPDDPTDSCSPPSPHHEIRRAAKRDSLVAHNHVNPIVSPPSIPVRVPRLICPSQRRRDVKAYSRSFVYVADAIDDATRLANRRVRLGASLQQAQLQCTRNDGAAANGHRHRILAESNDCRRSRVDLHWDHVALNQSIRYQIKWRMQGLHAVDLHRPGHEAMQTQPHPLTRPCGASARNRQTTVQARLGLRNHGDVAAEMGTHRADGTK
jgi:hypothetical protein